MALFSKRTAAKPPRLRSDEKACVAGYGQEKDEFRVVVRSRAVLAAGGRAVGPTFENDAKAQKFADWCNGKVRKFN